MLEIKEVLRLWCGGAAKKRIATQLGLDIKTVRRYALDAQASGPCPAGEASLDEARMGGRDRRAGAGLGSAARRAVEHL